jgi:hypothetical protein
VRAFKGRIHVEAEANGRIDGVTLPLNGDEDLTLLLR